MLRPVPTKRADTNTMDTHRNYDSISLPEDSIQNSLTESLIPLEKEGFQKDAWLFLRLFVAWFAIRSGDTLFLLDTPIRSEMLHFTKFEAAVLLTVYGISATVFSVPCGILGDREIVLLSETVIVSLGAALCGVSMCISLAYTAFGTMTLNSILFGIGTGKLQANICLPFLSKVICVIRGVLVRQSTFKF